MSSRETDPIEQAADALGVAVPPFSAVGAHVARFLFGRTPDILRESVVVDAPADRTFDAMGRVVPRAPWVLRLHDHDGRHPVAEAGVLVFMLPWLQHPDYGVVFAVRMRGIFVDRLFLRLSPDSGRPATTRIETALDLRREKRVAVRWALPIYAVAYVALGVGLAVMSARFGLGVGPEGTLVAIAVGAAVGLGWGVWALAATCRRATMRLARRELEALLGAIEREATRAESEQAA